jgi:hypothetical protein
LRSLRSIENVLPCAIEWGPTALSATPSCIPERMDAVRTPPRDMYGRIVAPEEAIDTTTGHPLVPAVLWIGAYRMHSRAVHMDRVCVVRGAR